MPIVAHPSGCFTVIVFILKFECKGIVGRIDARLWRFQTEIVHCFPFFYLLLFWFSFQMMTTMLMMMVWCDEVWCCQRTQMKWQFSDPIFFCLVFVAIFGLICHTCLIMISHKVCVCEFIFDTFQLFFEVIYINCISFDATIHIFN